MPRLAWRPGRRSPGWSLRAQLTVALVVAVAIFGAAAALLTARAYRQDRAAAGRQLASLARSAATRLDTQLTQSEQLLAGIAAQDAIAGLDITSCGLVLSGFRNFGPGYLVLVGPDDRVLCSSRPAGEVAPTAFTGAGWAADARRTGRPLHVEPVAEPVGRHPSIILAAPVPQPPAGAAPAVLAAVLDLDSFAPDLVGPLETDRGTVIAAVDAPGTTILFRHPGNYAGRPLQTRDPRGPGSSLFEGKGFDGVRRVYRAVTAPGLGWHVVAGTPVSVAFAPAHRTVSQSVALTIVVFCMLAFVALYLSRRLVRPADTALAERVAELAEARGELQRALVRFTEVQEDERRTIAQAVHDDTIQALIATMWALDDLDAAETSPRTAEVLERVRANLTQAVGAARSLLFELRPPALDELGLTAAVGQQLESLQRDAGLAVSLDSDVTGHLPVHIETLAFRAAQEALRNVRRHAAATAAAVTIRRDDDHVVVEVDDDGIGVNLADLVTAGPARAGIVGMRETIAMHGGSFSIGPRPAGGTRVTFSLPLPPAS